MYTFFNMTETEWKALEEIKRKAYESGRKAGFLAGFAAASGKSKEREEAHQQQKNGCGY